MDDALAQYVLAAMSPADKINELDDRHIKNVKPLVPPQIIMEELPLTIEALETVTKGRNDTEAIFSKQQDRLVVIVGPCSVHDARAELNMQKDCVNTLKMRRKTFTSLCACISKSHERPLAGRA